GKIVVLDYAQYGEICLKHLEDPVYECVSEFGKGRSHVQLANTELFNESFEYQDAADQLVKLLCKDLTTTLNKLLKSKHISAGEKKRVQPPQPYSGALPHFYGLPKVHKVGPMKIRPIIACCDNFSDKLMKVFKEILNLLL
ncbi:MAG: hypothetical protein GY861_10635, partial [bacterium]|nr:hypothetical protein [bacterium]